MEVLEDEHAGQLAPFRGARPFASHHLLVFVDGAVDLAAGQEDLGYAGVGGSEERIDGHRPAIGVELLVRVPRQPVAKADPIVDHLPQLLRLLRRQLRRLRQIGPDLFHSLAGSEPMPLAEFYPRVEVAQQNGRKADESQFLDHFFGLEKIPFVEMQICHAPEDFRMMVGRLQSFLQVCHCFLVVAGATRCRTASGACGRLSCTIGRRAWHNRGLYPVV